MKPMKQDKSFRRVSASEAEALLKSGKVSVLDTRDPAAFARERIEGAALLGSANLDAVIRGAPKGQPVLIYCYRGNASQVYAQTFVDFGFREVYDLIGGFDAWRTHLTAAATAASNAYQPSAALRAWLVEHGFPTDDPAAAIENRTTPLMHAARLGARAIAAELIERGAALDAANNDGNNALWLACFSGDPELVDLLIEPPERQRRHLPDVRRLGWQDRSRGPPARRRRQRADEIARRLQRAGHGGQSGVPDAAAARGEASPGT
jgi:rhodanese-related sulfurtransferase